MKRLLTDNFLIRLAMAAKASERSPNCSGETEIVEIHNQDSFRARNVRKPSGPPMAGPLDSKPTKKVTTNDLTWHTAVEGRKEGGPKMALK